MNETNPKKKYVVKILPTLKKNGIYLGDKPKDLSIHEYKIGYMIQVPYDTNGREIDKIKRQLTDCLCKILNEKIKELKQ